MKTVFSLVVDLKRTTKLRYKFTPSQNIHANVVSMKYWMTPAMILQPTFHSDRSTRPRKTNNKIRSDAEREMRSLGASLRRILLEQNENENIIMNI